MKSFSTISRSEIRRDLRKTDLQMHQGVRESKRESDSGADVDAFHCLASEWMRA